MSGVSCHPLRWLQTGDPPVSTSHDLGVYHHTQPYCLLTKEKGKEGRKEKREKEGKGKKRGVDTMSNGSGVGEIVCDG